ncbi:uncharacterized protein LOC121329822 isoform X1 [Polyodon spathula]|uniref:uncharacterized protein LOC121329822 isoform X1 n=1 Tax=Polyodon spathula TaxID=7913 RepID=UPI001B7EA54D|nr:uncharacterized protein LOC121329822 isoform X1 [Polyodon spathula]
MKTPDSELTSQISQVQVMVSELRAGFGSALQELSSIQHSDALLQKHIDQTREDCSLQIQELRGLVFSLKDDLQVALCEIRRVSDWQLRLQQDLDEGQRESTGLFDQHSHRSVTRGSSKSEEHAPAPPVCRNLRCYLQGFRPCQGQHSLSLQTECPWGTPEQCRGADCRIQPHPSETASGSSLGHNLQSPSHHGRRQQAAMELLQSERVYVSSLSQLQLHLGTALPPQAHRQELSQAFPACVQQLSQRHLLLRNTLEERVFSWKWQGMLGDVFAQLTSQDDGDFLDSYLTYVRLFPSCLLALRQSWSERPSTHLQDPAPGRNQQLLSLLSAPLSRIHSYLSHIQDLSRWTSGEHPDSYLLKLSERRLGCFLTQHRELMQEAVSQAEQCRAGGGAVARPLSPPSPQPSNSSGSLDLSSSTTRDSGVQFESTEHRDPADRSRDSGVQSESTEHRDPVDRSRDSGVQSESTEHRDPADRSRDSGVQSESTEHRDPADRSRDSGVQFDSTEHRDPADRSRDSGVQSESTEHRNPADRSRDSGVQSESTEHRNPADRSRDSGVQSESTEHRDPVDRSRDSGVQSESTEHRNPANRSRDSGVQSESTKHRDPANRSRGCGDSFLALSLRGHAWQNQLQGRDPQPHTALDSHRSDACIASSSNLPAQKYRGDKKLSSPKTAVQTGQSPAARALNGKQPSLEKDCAEDLDLIGASVFDYHSAGSSDSSPKTVRASAMARLPKNCGIPRDRDPTDTSSFTKNCGIPRDRDPTDTSSFTKNCGIPRDRDPTDTSSFTKNCGIPRDRDPTDTSSFTKNCGIPRDRDPTDTSSFTKNCGIPRDRDPTDTSSFTNNCGIPRDRDPTDTESSAEGSEPQVIRAKPQLKLTSQGSPRIPASPCKAPHTVPGRESGEQPESQRAAHRGVRVVHSAPVLPSSLGQHSTNWKEMSKPETSHHLSRVSCKREKRVQKSERSKSSDAVYPAARVKLRSLQEVTMQNSQHCSLDHMLPKHKLSNYSVAGLGSLEECEDNTAPCSAV